MTTAETITNRAIRSIGDIVLIGGACLFASWTIFCNIMVLSESGFADLMAWSFVPVAIGLALAVLCLRNSAPNRSRGHRSHVGANINGLLRPILFCAQIPQLTLNTTTGRPARILESDLFQAVLPPQHILV